MKDELRSNLPDPVMQGAPHALLRAARSRAPAARQTGTPLVVARDGVVIEIEVTDEFLANDPISRTSHR
jgi:hypothetical protein